MHPRDYILERQFLWARRRGIRLGGPFRNSAVPEERERGRKVWVFRLEDNLFEPLTAEARAAFEQGDGGELQVDRPGEGNMHALHSSSAAGCNLFHYWHRLGQAAPIARALGLPTASAVALGFEEKYPIDPRRSRPPNLDAVISYRKGPLKAAAVECKFCEPYGRPHGGLDPAYLGLDGIWDGLARLRGLAETISPEDGRFERLHAAQLVKHILGLSRAHGARGFRLLYCWYDAPGPAAERHRQEVEEFRGLAATDGVTFQATTYQDVILRLAKSETEQHRAYVDYLAERYL